jgi:hypothetical protein
MIPMLMRLVVSDTGSERSGVNIWLPLFLVWILLLPVIVLCLFLWLILNSLARFSPVLQHGAKSLGAAAVVLWKMHGLRIDISSRESRFVLHF